MTNVQFDDNSDVGFALSKRFQNSGSRMSRFIIKLGLAKTEAQAQIVLLIVAVLITGLAIVMSVFANRQAPPPVLTKHSLTPEQLDILKKNAPEVYDKLQP